MKNVLKERTRTRRTLNHKKARIFFNNPKLETYITKGNIIQSLLEPLMNSYKTRNLTIKLYIKKHRSGAHSTRRRRIAIGVVSITFDSCFITYSKSDLIFCREKRKKR